MLKESLYVKLNVENKNIKYNFMNEKYYVLPLGYS